MRALRVPMGEHAVALRRRACAGGGGSVSGRTREAKESDRDLSLSRGGRGRLQGTARPNQSSYMLVSSALSGIREAKPCAGFSGLLVRKCG